MSGHWGAAVAGVFALIAGGIATIAARSLIAKQQSSPSLAEGATCREVNDPIVGHLSPAPGATGHSLDSRRTLHPRPPDAGPDPISPAVHRLFATLDQNGNPAS